MQVRPSGPTDARVIIVGEAPGEKEEEQGAPFVGASGFELTAMLQAAGIPRSACFLTNVVRARPPGNNIGAFIALKKKDRTKAHQPLRDRMVLPVVREGYELLKLEIELVKPTVIIALGNVAMWALTGKWGITDWRGSELWTDQIKLADGRQPVVIPTLHPAAILRQWSMRWVVVQDLVKAREFADGAREVFRADNSYLIRPSFDQAISTIAMLQSLAQASSRLALSVDIETRAGHIACIGLAWNTRDAICIPLMESSKEQGYWSTEEEFAIISALRRLFLSPSVAIIGQNFLYDAQYIERHWCFLPIAFHDTMLAQHAMFSNTPKDLGFLSSIYCRNHIYWKNDGKTWDKNTGEEQLWRYNSEDCIRTFEIAMEQLKSIEHNGMQGVNAFQQSLAGPVLRTMGRGVRMDQKHRNKMALDLQEAICERELWLKAIFGHAVNVRSPKQLYTLLVEDLKQRPVLKRRKTADGFHFTPSFDDESLHAMVDREYLLKEIMEVILEIRSLGIFFKTFVSAPLDYDGRMRCSYNIGGTVTYRFSSSESAFNVGTNLQNIPKGDD